MCLPAIEIDDLGQCGLERAVAHDLDVGRMNCRGKDREQACQEHALADARIFGAHQISLAYEERQAQQGSCWFDERISASSRDIAMYQESHSSGPNLDNCKNKSYIGADPRR